jgi:N-acetyl-D-muramate 6-phosphate phosphatase
MSQFQAILFDLDGTLIDSAPDLGAAANRMRERRGLAPWPLARYRAMAGAGARGMLGVGFGVKPQMPGYTGLREEFFCEYENDLLGHTQAFDGIASMLEQLQNVGLLWGVVTNKSERFTKPIAKHMPLLANCKTLVAGDTTPHAKPHPAPVLEACRQLGIAPQHVLYVGDDERDIAAGRAAGTHTAACTWGYLGKNQNVHSWHADWVVTTPAELLTIIQK